MALRSSARLSRLIVTAVLLALLATLVSTTSASAASGAIAGKVTKPDGKPHKGSTVELYSIKSDEIWFEKSTVTKTDGTYSFGSLPKGKYIVGFAPNSQTYATEFWKETVQIERAYTISVGSSKVSGINAKLDVGAKVSGRVVADSDSRPVAGAEVIAYRQDEFGWTYGRSVLTAADGSYTVGGLSNGFWTLEFNPPQDGPDADLALEYWDDNRVFDSSEALQLKLGSSVTGKDASLAQGGRISGRVTGPNGEPVTNAVVFGYPAESAHDVGNVAFTDEDGRYVMTGLSAGEHSLEFVYGFELDPFGDEPRYVSEWWDDQGSHSTANRVVVAAGETSSGKDAELEDLRAPMVNTSPPTIKGEPQVGEDLSVDPGSWSLQVDGAKLEYQWFADGKALFDELEPTMDLISGYAGMTLTVKVTATSRSGRTASAMSAPLGPVRRGVLRNLTKPSIDGPLRVGSEIRLENGTWNTESNKFVELLADGEVVGTGRYHRLTNDHLGKKLSVRVTASRDGFESATVTSDEVGPVTEGAFEAPTPVIQDVPFVGIPVRVAPQGGETGDFNYAYQWFADGVEIDGAVGPEFTPSASQLGTSLTARMTMSRPGYATVSKTSPPALVREPGSLRIEQVGKPRIQGLITVGEKLEVVGFDYWRPAPAAFEYQWLADGNPINGATGRDIVLSESELGKRVSVTVTGSRPGYVSASATTDPTEPILRTTPFGAPQGLRVTDATVTTVDLAWKEVDQAAGYRITYRTASSLDEQTFDVGPSMSARITGLNGDQGVTIWVASLRADGTRSEDAYLRARTEPLSPPQGLRVTKKTSSSISLAWTKVPGVPKYRIWHGIGSGTRTKTEVGDVDSVTIKGLKSGKTYTVDIASMLSDGTRSDYTPRISVKTK